jgi:protoheme IX farnesyltransferase
MATDCRESSTVLLDEPARMDDREPDNADVDLRSAAEPEPEIGTPVPLKPEPTLTRDFVELTKPRIVTMILVTTMASAWIAMAGGTGVSLSLFQWAMLLLGTGLVAGSAGAANQVWERVIDTLMPRTSKRPLASRRMRLVTGVAFTAVTGTVGASLLAWQFGIAPAAVGVATWALYVLVYTPMKTRTAWNTTVGAIAGALPVFMGYTAGGGTLTELPGWMLFGVLAAWQYPHFMAIAWLYRRQYAEAGFQMTTTVEPTGYSAAWQSIVGTIALAGCGVMMCFAPAGELIVSAASVITSLFVIAASYPLLRAAIRFAREREDVPARKMLRWSLVVLPAVLLIATLRMIGL